MAYIFYAGAGHQVIVENQGQQTAVATVSSGPGQQQSQRTSFTTGTWTAPPVAFRTPAGIVLEITTAQGQNFVNIAATGISTVSEAPNLAGAEELPAQQGGMPAVREMEPMEPMKPMSPMKPMAPMKPISPVEPMKMGDMEMRMNPMEMRIGNMSMSMGNPLSAGAGKNFCSQCGATVQPSDRFCTNCGHRLM
jgi:hypothetical protein